jgi:hypothetical protein
MKIKKNTFSTLVLELFFPSIANCRKFKIKNRLPLVYNEGKGIVIWQARNLIGQPVNPMAI